VTLFFSQIGSTRVVIHARRETVLLSPALPPEGVREEQRSLSVLVPVDMLLEVWIDVSEEQLEVVPFLLLEVSVILKSVQDVIDY
jgi:hypothetical protein